VAVPRLFESCIDSHDAALASASGGAGRVELCARLDVGGTTPDVALIERCVASLSVPVFVMIRPRGGDFVYDAGDVAAMADGIRAAAAAGAHGVVFGALQPDATIDAGIMRRLIDVARPLPVTCHKAIDATRDPLEALEALLTLGVDRVLTSGGGKTAASGAATIARLVARAGDALVVMAGGGVRAHNVAVIVQQTGVREVHARVLPAGTAGVEGAGTIAGWAGEISAVVDGLRSSPG
jgi:copper homeostasis protein